MENTEATTAIFYVVQNQGNPKTIQYFWNILKETCATGVDSKSVIVIYCLENIQFSLPKSTIFTTFAASAI